MKKNFKNVLLAVLAEVVQIAISYFVWQVVFAAPINIQSWTTLIELVFVVGKTIAIAFTFLDNSNFEKILMGLSIVLAVATIVYCFAGSPLFGGLKNYQNQVEVKEIAFTEIAEFNQTQVQLVDKNTAKNLGDRIFGQLGSDKVSQFSVGNDYNQISINGTLYRITPIDYSGFFSWNRNKNEGTPGFILVNCETGEVQIVETKNGMKVLSLACFSKSLSRVIANFGRGNIYASSKFECDDELNPYYVTPVLSTKFLGKTYDVKGVVITDPITGNCEYYDVDEVPEWVDNVYPVDIVYKKFNQSKEYANGLFNFSNKGVVKFTDDYAYCQFNDNVYIYTGVTSVGHDESNVGFVYVNLRTGKYEYIVSAGAEEYSARTSAEGLYQQYGYKAIFPCMVNVNGKATYFMGLVDSGNLIKAYAFVDYENYQLVGAGTTVKEALANFAKKTGKTVTADDEKAIETTIEKITSVVIDGNTYYLIKTEDEIYRCPINIGYEVAFLEEGQNVNVVVADNEIIEIK